MDSELMVRSASHLDGALPLHLHSKQLYQQGAPAPASAQQTDTSKGHSCAPTCPLRLGNPVMQLMETLEERPTQPHRSLQLKMFLLRDKGGQHKRRPSCVTRHLDVCWDPISAIGRVLLASYRSIASLLGEDLYKVVLFSDSSDRTLSMSSDTMRRTVKKHHRKTGCCPPKLSTPDGKPAKIKKLGLVLHGMRTKAGRRLANRLAAQELALYYNHKTPG